MDVFIIGQIFAFIVALSILFLQDKWHTGTNAAASILTTLGILGTFLGIYLGLRGFDIVDIEGSIPDLLEGIKPAFLTSIVGILSAIILKGTAWVISIQDSGEDSTLDKFVDQLTATLKNVQTSGEMNLLAQMVTLNKTITDEGRETRGALGSLKDDLAGIHTSLTGGQHETVVQLRGLTTTVSEKHDSLNTAIVEKHDSLMELQREEGSKTRETLTHLQGAVTEGQGALSAQLEKLAVTFSDIVEKHDSLMELQREEGSKTRETLTHLQGAVTEGQGALNTQLEKLAVTFSEKQDLLIEEFQAFSENVAEGISQLATDELIEALKSVVEDFNVKITEQFGENFKQLNEAVGKTVEWQEQYRQQMDELANEFRIAAESIDQSRAALASASQSLMTIEDQSEHLISIAEKLDPILHTLNDQLEAFSTLREKAHDAFPVIENRLNDLTIGFSDVVKAAITDSQASMETQRDSLRTHANQLQELSQDTTQLIAELTTNFSDNIKSAQDGINEQQEALNDQLRQLRSATLATNEEIKQAINSVSDHLKGVFEKSSNHMTQVTTGFTQNLNRQLKEILEGQSKELGNIVERNREDIENHVNTLHTALRKEVGTIEKSLETELSVSLRTLGGYYESLSSGFVNNYKELIVRYTQVLAALQELVDATRGVVR